LRRWVDTLEDRDRVESHYQTTIFDMKSTLEERIKRADDISKVGGGWGSAAVGYQLSSASTDSANFYVRADLILLGLTQSAGLQALQAGGCQECRALQDSPPHQ
jgi:hypothetical protein